MPAPSTYFDLIDTTFDFPQEGIELKQGILHFYSINLMELIRKYGTPLRVFYLPRIAQQIQNARHWFHQAFRRYGYTGKYLYAYCTKSSHFSFVLWEVLRHNVHLEISHTNDLAIVEWLWKKGWINQDILIIANGYKERAYAERIRALYQAGFRNLIPVLDDINELEYYEGLEPPIQIGIRIAAEEEPTFEFYTSRLGIRPSEIIPFYQQRIRNHPSVRLRMLHFFINTGIQDSPYYWSEFSRALEMYIALRDLCPDLDMFNIGGGFPVRNTLRFLYNYEEIVDEIVSQIHQRCAQENIPDPHLITEFGTFTVGEAGAHLFQVLGEKIQNDAERWYMLNGSIMQYIPDTWGLGERFIVLPVNYWDKPYQRVNLGGLSCDAHDYYNSEVHLNHVFLPILPENPQEEPLYVAFLHTGAYQDALAGFGGIQHCLIPAPRYLVIYQDDEGQLHHWLFAEPTSSEAMLNLLGYHQDNPLPTPAQSRTPAGTYEQILIQEL